MLSASPDRGVHPRRGEVLELRIRLTRVDGGGIPEFYTALHQQRGAGHEVPERRAELPLSEAARLVLTKWDRDNWDETLGTYRSEGDAQAALPFVAGWCGGMMTQQAQLASDNPLTRERARRSLAWYWSRAAAPSGLLWTRWQRSAARLTHDQCHRQQPTRKRQTLVRRYGEIIERAIKQFDVLRQQEPDWQPPAAWSAAITGCCDALVRIWREQGQWGQWLDAETGAVLVGNSTSGIGCAAALTCAGVFYGRPDWIVAAASAAESLHLRDVRQGLTTGGPGDALAAPDSESGYAAIAAPIALWEATRDPRWLDYASEAADLFASWVLAYEWPYPAASTLGRMGKRTLGAVWANVQNKHGAPGICTASGDALLRLYRATGERRFLHLLRDIVQALPAYVSREDTPIADQQGRAMPSGWINERITTNDWMEPPGEVFYGSCWCEVSLLLTAHELPGIYVRSDEAWACALDHLEVAVEAGSRLRISNPTAFAATTTVLVEDAATAAQPLRWNPFLRSERIRIPAGQSISVPL
jgi:hypothetical protein